MEAGVTGQSALNIAGVGIVPAPELASDLSICSMDPTIVPAVTLRRVSRVTHTTVSVCTNNISTINKPRGRRGGAKEKNHQRRLYKNAEANLK